MPKKEVDGILWYGCDGPQCDASTRAKDFADSGFISTVSANERGMQYRYFCKECCKKFEEKLGVRLSYD